LEWSQRIGPLSLVILLGGLVCILGTLAFLYFLWLSDATNIFWQQIVLAGWVTRSITIASLIIRVIIAAQAGVCTSMVAALLLHRGAVMLPHFASVCLQQLDNSGPHRLAWVVIGKQHLWEQLTLGVALVALCLTNLYSQFTSTILLSAVHLGPVSGLNESLNLPYGLNMTLLVDNSNFHELFWKKRPTTFPSWAEYEEPPVHVDGVHDTGMSYRALLPVNLTSQRQPMISFDGVATADRQQGRLRSPSIPRLNFSNIRRQLFCTGSDWSGWDEFHRSGPGRLVRPRLQGKGRTVSRRLLD
jgi:hypothetical protein